MFNPNINKVKKITRNIIGESALLDVVKSNKFSIIMLDIGQKRGGHGNRQEDIARGDYP